MLVVDKFLLIDPTLETEAEGQAVTGYMLKPLTLSYKNLLHLDPTYWVASSFDTPPSLNRPGSFIPYTFANAVCSSC